VKRERKEKARETQGFLFDSGHKLLFENYTEDKIK
jgi:hypothetical protein